jgi:hypothetical protein
MDRGQANIVVQKLPADLTCLYASYQTWITDEREIKGFS